MQDLNRFVDAVNKAQDLLARTLALDPRGRNFTAQDVADVQLQLDDLAKLLRDSAKNGG